MTNTRADKAHAIAKKAYDAAMRELSEMKARETMSDETTLLPCPFCGGEIPAPTRRYMSVLICPTCNAYGPGNSDMTNDELIAVWNTRAYLNQDGLPAGLTISDGGTLLNWRGENYVKQGALGNGTLTAEQVREAVMSADRWEKPMGNTGLTNTHLIIRDDGWQAIADELSAELGSGTCELEPLSALDVTLNMLDSIEWGACSECGCAVPMDAKFCNECGKVVKR